MMTANKIILLLGMTAVVPACLQTRADLKRDGTVGSIETARTPAKTPSMQSAQSDARFEEVNKDFRELNGRIEILENQLRQGGGDEKTRTLENKITQLEQKISLLEATVTDLNNKARKEAAAPAKKDELAEASELFENKKWEDAILAFEEYRKNNPKGKSYAEATYKIGVAFQSLGMKDDAKAFYKEVAEKFPNSKEAGLAKNKLKKI
jgi:TolA-binding protein